MAHEAWWRTGLSTCYYDKTRPAADSIAAGAARAKENGESKDTRFSSIFKTPAEDLQHGHRKSTD